MYQGPIPQFLAGLTGPGQADGPSVVDLAMQQFPVLNKIGLKSVVGQRGDNVLEFWPPGEPGSTDYARPGGLPLNSPGVEVGPNAKPLDILGDVVSHHLVNTDPMIKKIYSAFTNSVTPQQEQLLQKQYSYARQNEGENRDFETWKETSGLPAYFRGHPFQQWPADFNKRAYTPKQIMLLDGMMRYLSGQQ